MTIACVVLTIQFLLLFPLCALVATFAVGIEIGCFSSVTDVLIYLNLNGILSYVSLQTQWSECLSYSPRTFPELHGA